MLGYPTVLLRTVKKGWSYSFYQEFVRNSKHVLPVPVRMRTCETLHLQKNRLKTTDLLERKVKELKSGHTILYRV